MWPAVYGALTLVLLQYHTNVCLTVAWFEVEMSLMRVPTFAKWPHYRFASEPLTPNPLRSLTVGGIHSPYA